MGASYMQDDAMSVRSGASRASRSSRVSGSSKASKSRRSKSKGKSSIMEAPKKPPCTPETVRERFAHSCCARLHMLHASVCTGY